MNVGQGRPLVGNEGINIEFEPQNEQQRSFLYATERNQCFSGGFNNGKTYDACFKALLLLMIFNRYKMAICRQTYADLKKTTMQTFFKLCPSGMLLRHNEQDGYTMFRNGSQIQWMHLDKVEESTLRGLEINSVLVDQAEEIEEKTYDILDARVGRWDRAQVPDYLKGSIDNWPLNNQGHPLVPSYHMLLCNPDTQFHFIYRHYHPDSLERKKNHFFVEGEWDKNLGSLETYEKALEHDDEWVAKYVKGQWGRSNAQIHRLDPISLLDWTPELWDKIRRTGSLYRCLDHGDTSPTCCLWFASVGDVYICYREYYVPNQLISYHRRAIHELSAAESYTGNYADPSIFDKPSQKKGGYWNTADEYMTRDLSAPPLTWLAADNNEYATRNRINELLHSKHGKHPITGDPGPQLYFIKKSESWPNGCFHAINELQAQRRKLIGYVDGKAVYSDERENRVLDHAYDPIRYFVAMHGSPLSERTKPPNRNTLRWYRALQKKTKGILVPASS